MVSGKVLSDILSEMSIITLKFKGFKNKKSRCKHFSSPLLPFLYIKSVVCNRYGCYHSFLGVSGFARDGKQKPRPGILDSRSGINEKVYTKNGLYQNGRSSFSSTSTSLENSCGAAFRGAASPWSVGCSRLANVFILPTRSLFLTS